MLEVLEAPAFQSVAVDARAQVLVRGLMAVAALVVGHGLGVASEAGGHGGGVLVLGIVQGTVHEAGMAIGALGVAMRFVREGRRGEGDDLRVMTGAARTGVVGDVTSDRDRRLYLLGEVHVYLAQPEHLGLRVAEQARRDMAIHAGDVTVRGGLPAAVVGSISWQPPQKSLCAVHSAATREAPPNRKIRATAEMAKRRMRPMLTYMLLEQ